MDVKQIFIKIKAAMATQFSKINVLKRPFQTIMIQMHFIVQANSIIFRMPIPITKILTIYLKLHLNQFNSMNKNKVQYQLKTQTIFLLLKKGYLNWKKIDTKLKKNY